MRLAYKVFYRVFKRFSYVEVPLDAGDFWLIDRRVGRRAERCSPRSTGSSAGCAPGSGFGRPASPTSAPSARSGVSTNNLVKNLGWARRAIISLSYAPLDFITLLALATVGGAFVAMVVQIVLKLAFPDLAPKGFTTLLVVITFLGRDPAAVSQHHRFLPRAHVRGGQEPAGVRRGGGPQPASPARAGVSGARRALVTGAAGFVGANLVRRLVEDGHAVDTVVRPGGDDWRLDAMGLDVAIHSVDLCDSTAARALVQETRPDWVFNLAAHGAYSWQEDAARIMATNTAAVVNLVNACAGAGCEAFVHAGSSSEYGIKDHAPDEDEPLEPNGAYGVAKAAASLYCRQAGRNGTLAAVVLRLYSVFGPYEAPRRLVPQLIVQGRAGGLPPLVNPGVAHDFVAIDDVLDAFVRAAERASRLPGAAFNIGTGRQTTLAEAVETARRTLGVVAEPEWGADPGRPWDTTTWVSDPRRAGRELDWQAKLSFEQGFERTVAWFEANPWTAERYGDGR